MITKPTVLILGAGASINYGFPSGLQLKALICKEIKERADIFNDLRKVEGDEHSMNYVDDFYHNLLLSQSELVPVIVGGLLATPLVHSLCHL